MDAKITVNPAAEYSYSFYVGPWDDSNARSMDVELVLNPGNWSLVYPSGAFSGESEKRVIDVDEFWVLEIEEENYLVGPGFVAYNEDNVSSVGQGDSGGPVYFPAFFDDPTSRYGLARGIMSAVQDPQVCECVGMTWGGGFVVIFH